MTKQPKNARAGSVQQTHRKQNTKYSKHTIKLFKKKKLTKQQLMASFLLRIMFIIFISLFTIAMFYVKANKYGSRSLISISRQNLKKYYRQPRIDIQSESIDDGSSGDGRTNIYTLDILNNHCVSENDVDIQYTCSQRTDNIYDRYKVSVSGNNIKIDKTYNNSRGNNIKEVDLIINHRNIESLNGYLNDEDKEKVIEFTKYVYDNNVKRTVSNNEVEP